MEIKIRLTENDIKMLFKALERASISTGESWNEFDEMKQKIMRQVYGKE